MRTLTTILTLSAVLLHALLGCCSHHAHAEEPVLPNSQVVDSDSAAACPHAGCQLGDRHEPGGEPDGDEPRPENCDEDSCDFVAAGDADKAPRCCQWPAWDGIASAALIASLHAASFCCCEISDFSPAGQGSTLRIHEMNQVWLI